jgi:hypothetical protein
MKFLLLIALLLPQVVLADLEYVDIVEIDGLTLKSTESAFELSEGATIKNRAGVVVRLSEIILPTSIKADIVSSESGNIINWAVLIDSINNEVVPE